MDQYDLLIIGGGINGAAIARDAAGRGLSVLLVERDDLASHTSSASSKLIHGGLRYLETYEFRLVRESLAEREVLLRTAPHIVRPLRFVLPDPGSGRPWWLVRIGLGLYGLLAGPRSSLGRPRGVPAGDAAVRKPLKAAARLAQYWDAWVDDARLVVLNALDAAERGAQIATRTEFQSARRTGDSWSVSLSGGRAVTARMIVNAAGPWVAEVLGRRLTEDSKAGVRLVKGSHIVVPRVYEGDHAYLLQQPDGRVVFALPYGTHNLIGTTDTQVASPDAAQIDADEVDYLCAASNRAFHRQITPADMVHHFAGIRALYDDGAADAKDVTRDYRLELDDAPGPRLLSVFGGKVTTARALASEVMDRLGVGGVKFTRTTALPGGDLTPAFNTWLTQLAEWMPAATVRRMAEAYGTRLQDVIGTAGSLADLGRHFGADLYEAEVRYHVTREFALTGDDVLWRRSKLGLQLSEAERAAVIGFVSTLVARR